MAGFDVQGAKKAGYSDAEIADYLGQQSKFDVAGARKAGYSDQELIAHLMQPAAAPAAASPGLPEPTGNTEADEANSLPAGSQLVASSLASIPGGIANAGIDLLSRATGFGPNKPIPNVPAGQAGQDLAKQIGQAAAPAVQAVQGVANAVDRRLGDSTAANVLRDVSRNAAAVGGDVLQLLPGAGALRAAEGVGARVIDDTAPLWARAGYKSAEEAQSAAAGFRNGRGQGMAMALSGSDARRALTDNNLDVGNVIAHHASGVPHDVPLTYEALDAALQEPQSVYQRVAAGIPNGDAVLQRLGTARHDGFRALQSTDPEVVAHGRELLREADGIENYLERQITPYSGTSLEQFRAARQAIAQNRAVYDTLQGHDMDLAALGRMYQNAPNKFSGGLKIAAQFATDNGLVVGRRIGQVGDQSLRVAAHAGSLGNPTTWPGAVGVTGLPQRALVRGGGTENAMRMFPGRPPGAFEPEPIRALTPPPGTVGNAPPVQTGMALPPGPPAPPPPAPPAPPPVQYPPAWN